MSIIATLKSRLQYLEDTGEFRWISAPNHYTVGNAAGSLDGQGYRRISIDGRLYKAHRLAWAFVYGEMPISEIDHINGNRDDNRISNLRLANRFINTQNVSTRKDSTSGYMGVSFYRPTGKWKAQIKCAGKTTHLGYHLTPELAHAAYMDAKQKLHPGFARAIERAHGIGIKKGDSHG